MISSTRTSSAMASRSLRRFSACLASLETRSSRFSLVRPSTRSADFLAEQPIDLDAGGVGILDRVVQQRRGDGGVVELEIGEDRGDLQRMGEIRIAGSALLLAMRAHGVDVGAVEQVLVGRGIILLDPVDQLVLPHQRAACAALARALADLRHEIRAARQPRPAVRGWFCIRGKSIGDRAMTILVLRRQKPARLVTISWRGPSATRRRAPTPWAATKVAASWQTYR